MGSVTVIVGLQYGSEGKGYIAHLLASTSDLAVRTGGPNAGHTLHHRGRTFKLRQVPCAFVNPACILLIGPGGYVNFSVLRTEIEQIESAGYQLSGRLFVHESATVIEKHHVVAEEEIGLRQRIGSTLEGIGAATSERALRTARTARDLEDSLPAPAAVLSAAEYLDLVHGSYDSGSHIVLEGTQGALLSLYHGRYPMVTSRDITAGSLLGAAGLAPGMVTEVIGVARTFPIRGGGNSGPLPYETSFKELDLEPELTTVTKKPRRIGRFDPIGFRNAMRLNRPTSLALSFMDYLPEDGRRSFQQSVERLSGVPVDYLGGPFLDDAWVREGSLLGLARSRWEEIGGISSGR